MSDLFDDNRDGVKPRHQSKDKLDIDLVFHTKTDKAVLVSQTGLNRQAIWLPTVGFDPVDYRFINKLTMGEDRDGVRKQFEIVTVTISERLARQKGLI